MANTTGRLQVELREELEDVIAAMRLAEIGTDDYDKFGRVALKILGTAPDTPDDNKGGVELLLRLQRSGELEFELRAD